MLRSRPRISSRYCAAMSFVFKARRRAHSRACVTVAATRKTGGRASRIGKLFLDVLSPRSPRLRHYIPIDSTWKRRFPVSKLALIRTRAQDSGVLRRLSAARQSYGAITKLAGSIPANLLERIDKRCTLENTFGARNSACAISRSCSSGVNP